MGNNKQCHICEKSFVAKVSNAKYCSVTCSKKGARRLRKNHYLTEKSSKKQKTYNRTCKYCEKTFTSKDHRNKYCSDPCQKEGRKEYRRNLSAKKKEEGICPHCLIRPHNGKNACEVCRKSSSVSTKKRRKFLNFKGLCRDCGSPKAENKTLCEKCLKKANIRSNKYIETLKEASVCIRCREKLPNNFIYFTCRRCLNDFNEKNLQVKKEVLSFYSTSHTYACSCCSINILDFLSLDHINNDGAEDRKKKRRTGISLYSHLARKNFPEGFQTLCQNCNLGKHTNGGICPHKDIFHEYTADAFKIKSKILDYYGSRCNCCAEHEMRFLTIDHINENGAEHRSDLGVGTGHNFYHWIIKNDFPDDLQTFCLNCNIGKHLNNGICPHNLVKSEI